MVITKNVLGILLVLLLALAISVGMALPQNAYADTTAEVVSVTNEVNPLVEGTASGTDTVGFSLSGTSGDKVYGSGDIAVADGAWSHRIEGDIADGDDDGELKDDEYILTLSIDNVEVDSFEFTIDTTEEGDDDDSDDALSISELIVLLQSLIVQVQELQAQLNTIRGEVKSILRDGLAQGMTDEDIAKIQELLATDPAIYPEGLVTGYFGPLTKGALMRFQFRHEIRMSGEIDEDTKALLEEYLHEGFGDNIPPGLLRAPGIIKKVELRFTLGCDNRGHGTGPLCKKFKIKFEGEIEDDDEDNSDATEAEAQADLDEAQAAIVSAQDAIDNASDGIDTTDAEALLANAQTALDDAQVSFDAGDYEEASDQADDAENFAEDAQDSVDAAEEQKTEAVDAISDADDAIASAQAAIDASSEDTTEAEALLAEAEALQVEANDAFDADDFVLAEEKADDAKDKAEVAELAVPTS